MEVKLQLAAFKTSAVGTPTALAFDVHAAQVECAEKLSVSIPADFMIFFN